MPTVDLSLQGLLHGNFFNFLILFAIIFYVVKKINVSSLLEMGKQKVIEIIDKSDKDKAESQKAVENIKKEIEALPSELSKIKEEASSTIAAYQKASDKEIENIVQRVEQNAQKIIDTEIAKVNSVLQKEIAEKAIKTANEKTLLKLRDDNALHRKFIAEAIDKIEEIEFNV